MYFVSCKVVGWHSSVFWTVIPKQNLDYGILSQSHKRLPRESRSLNFILASSQRNKSFRHISLYNYKKPADLVLFQRCYCLSWCTAFYLYFSSVVWCRKTLLKKRLGFSAFHQLQLNSCVCFLTTENFLSINSTSSRKRPYSHTYIFKK